MCKLIRLGGFMNLKGFSVLSLHQDFIHQDFIQFKRLVPDQTQ